MVQKTAAMGAPLMVAVSAPTALAVRMADAAGITLVAIARADGFEMITHPGGIRFVSCSRLPGEALPTDILRKGTRS
jgi:FdhD protein